MTCVRLFFIVFVIVHLHCSSGRNLLSNKENEDLTAQPSIYQINSRFQSEGLVYGDILLTPDQKRAVQLNGWTVQRAIATNTGRWLNNTVPYELSSQYSSDERVLIRKALSDLESESCFKFPERNGHDDYVFVDKLSGCYSIIGRQGGRQAMSLAEACVVHQIVQHEFLHALGIKHEHQRPDRDYYVRVLNENVEPGEEHNFDKIPESEVDLNGIPYDYNSIMHYEAHVFGRMDVDGRPMTTLISLQKGVELLENQQLTSSDLKRLSILGNCSEIIEPKVDQNKKPRPRPQIRHPKPRRKPRGPKRGHRGPRIGHRGTKIGPQKPRRRN